MGTLCRFKSLENLDAQRPGGNGSNHSKSPDPRESGLLLLMLNH